MPLLTLNELESKVPIFKGRIGKGLCKALMWLLSADKVNDLYDRHITQKGPEFARSILNETGVKYQIINPEALKKLPEGAFITISNHPYGHIDGVMLVDLFGHTRPDFKVMVNKFLGRIEPLSGNFICVSPTGTERTDPAKDSIQGIKESVVHIRNGHPIGIFPSGAVSDLSIKDWDIRDREWQDPAIKFIHKMNIPIVPVHFIDRNSWFYYFLGLIHWKIRLLRLPAEVFNKKGRRTRISIGATIWPEDQKRFTEIDGFKDFLRKSLYSCPEREVPEQ